MEDNLRIRKLVRTILVFLSTCFIIIMGWILIDCFTTKNNATDKIISYRVKDDIEYSVTLKDNQFYTDQEAMDKNLYVTALLDTLQLNFNYSLSGSRFFKSDYNYKVVLSLTAKDGEEVVWKYEEDALTQVNESVVDVMEVSLSEIVNVDLSHLYNMANDYYEMTNYPVVLDINVIINNNLKIDGYTNGVKDREVLSLSIPITEKVVSIEKSLDNDYNKKIFHQYEVNESFNIYLFIVSGIVLLILIPVTIRSYIALFNLINLENYIRKLNRLKIRYKDVLKNVKTKPDFDKKDVYEVLTCNELYNMACDKDLDINYYEKNKSCETWFYVVDKKDVYIYYLALDYEHVKLSNKGSIKFNRKNKKSK